MHPLPIVDLPGPPEEAGYSHGRLIASFFEPAFLDAYLDSLSRINRCDPPDLVSQADRWLDNLPTHHQVEIDAMGAGAGVTPSLMARFLYADIARPSRGLPVDPARPAQGPMCSGIIARHDHEPWIARNCDWLAATLVRGTAGVVHRLPNRIPVMAVGIAGDIDVDTGLNAEGLWLHLHTLMATDDPPRDRTTISWLFWAREALETCATLDDLERFIEATSRDRGVIAVAAHGPSGQGAVFECTRADHVRHDLDATWIAATNHPLAKRLSPERVARSREGSTVARHGAMCALLEDGPPEHLPDDLIDVLADPRVEMRTPTYLRTIYSAIARPGEGEIWFAAGRPDGTPAASTGDWSRVAAPF